MRIASETVWATADGKLVAAGDKDAAILVTSKGHPVSDKKLATFGKSEVGKFFKDAAFDRHGSIQLPQASKPAEPLTYSRLDTLKATKAAADSEAEAAEKRAKELQKKREAAATDAPSPRNREEGLKFRKRNRSK